MCISLDSKDLFSAFYFTNFVNLRRKFLGVFIYLIVFTYFSYLCLAFSLFIFDILSRFFYF